MRGTVACVIPAFNAAAPLPRVIAGLRDALPEAILIGVDDGSSDRTAAVIASRCDRAIVLGRNRGKGAALRAGFADALTLDVDVVVALDADGQHDPALAPALLAALDDADVVVGARERTPGRMPLRRRMTNALSAAAARRLAGCELADPQSGYRAIRSVVVREVHARGDRYEFETDFLLLAARAGFRITAVPIPTIYGPPSHFREMRDGLRVVATFCRHAWDGVAE